MEKNKSFLYKLVFIALSLNLIIMISSTALANIRIEPSRIIINAIENKNATGVIEVVNKGEKEVELTALLNDWSLDNRDALLFFDPGKTDYTLDGLIKFNPKKFTLAPEQKQIVRFTVSKPETDSPRERRGVVFIEHETDLIDEATGSRVKTQVGTVIYYIPEGVKYSFKFTGLRVYNTPEPTPQGISLRIKNDGEAHIRYYPSYKIVDSGNEIVMEKKLNELLILPGYERQFSFYLENRLPSGNYNFLLKFDLYNTDQVADYQIPIKIE